MKKPYEIISKFAREKLKSLIQGEFNEESFKVEEYGESTEYYLIRVRVFYKGKLFARCTMCAATQELVFENV